MKTVLLPWIILLRPHQWIKNFFLFAPLFFSFDFSVEKVVSTTLGFVVFSLAASSIYVLNDYFDIKEDQEHPIKKFRPIASGDISKKQASLTITIGIIISILSAVYLSFAFGCIITLYIIINILYSIKLKHIAILDITIIAVGFVLRVFAGAVLIDVVVSMWIVLVTFLLAMFLALAKRRDDVLLAQKGQKTRKNIDGYNLEMLNASMVIMVTTTLLSYIMYTVSPEVTTKLQTDYLYITSLFVIIGVLRYLQITLVEEDSSSPTKIILKDRFLQFIVAFWMVSFYLIVKVF